MKNAMKPYVFAHRGASGYEIENTISAFKKAVCMGAGIETDLTYTKDKKLVCFHDPFFKAGRDHYFVQNLTYQEIQTIEFDDHRKVPLLEDVFQIFKDKSDNLRYSFDIANKNVGLDLIHIAEKANLFDKIEITDRRLSILSFLHKLKPQVKLIYTIPERITNISTKSLDLERLSRIGVHIINIRCRKNIKDLFKQVVDNNLKCYIWGVNTTINMKKVLKLRYKDKIVSAIYTDYPDKLINLIKDHIK